MVPEGAHPLTLAGAALLALPSGALLWPEARTLVVADLHLGKSERMARRGGAFLPPYETLDTITRLQAEIDHADPRRMICLGDSFDDLDAAQALGEPEATALRHAMRGRDWIWAEGNHDPGPVPFGGAHVAELAMPPLTFRHVAEPGAAGEVSGHYHPKARLVARGGAVTRPCFLIDRDRLVMPAFGTYTGGLAAGSPTLRALMRPGAVAVLTGRRATAIPMPRLRRAG